MFLDAADLANDADAIWIIKHEEVDVEFAGGAGQLMSRVGVNRYQAGDALLTGSDDRWCVSRDRFDARYLPVGGTLAGQGGRYRNVPMRLRAKRMRVPFRVARSAGGDVLNGEPGDWLVEYAPGDHGIVAQARFDRVYRIVAGP